MCTAPEPLKSGAEAGWEGTRLRALLIISAARAFTERLPSSQILQRTENLVWTVSSHGGKEILGCWPLVPPPSPSGTPLGHIPGARCTSRVHPWGGRAVPPRAAVGEISRRIGSAPFFCHQPSWGVGLAVWVITAGAVFRQALMESSGCRDQQRS